MRFFAFSFIKNCTLKNFSPRVPRAYCTLKTEVKEQNVIGDPSLVEVCPSWPEGEEVELREAFLRDMQVIPDFVSEQEEASLMSELEPYLKRMRYEFDHWDNAIQGYRETERSAWRADNEAVLRRVRARACGALEPLPHAHVLDLAAAGFIRPHVDAVRFCGAVIAGVCLLSSAVMRLEHAARPELAAHALLQRRALYIMRGVARYDFSHAVLGGEHSVWRGRAVARARRVALIVRSKPRPQDQHQPTHAS